jgi:transposase-like protein
MSENKKGAKLTRSNDVKVQALTEALSAGHYMERACRMAGLSQSTVYRWLQEAEKIKTQAADETELTESERHYLELSDAILKARDKAAHRAMVSIQKASQKGTWQAAAWYLERTDPNHYGRRTQISGPDSQPVKVNVTVDEVAALLKEVLDEDDNA